MNKTELIEHIQQHANIPKASAARALEATLDAVTTTLRRGGTVEDVANCALYLASDLSSYVSGQVIQVDGGMNT